jgi:hypothetical protein
MDSGGLWSKLVLEGQSYEKLQARWKTFYMCLATSIPLSVQRLTAYLVIDMTNLATTKVHINWLESCV